MPHAAMSKGMSLASKIVKGTQEQLNWLSGSSC